MIGVRTPLGKKWHFADSVTSTNAYCGKAFSAGFDHTEDEQNLTIKTAETCGICRAARNRRRFS